MYPEWVITRSKDFLLQSFGMHLWIGIFVSDAGINIYIDAVEDPFGMDISFYVMVPSAFFRSSYI